MDPSKESDDLKAQKTTVDYNNDGKGHTINTGYRWRFVNMGDRKAFNDEVDNATGEVKFILREGVEDKYDYIHPNYGEPTDLIPLEKRNITG